MLVDLGVPWELQARGDITGSIFQVLQDGADGIAGAECDIIGDILHVLHDGMDEIAMSRDAFPGSGSRLASCS